MFRLILLAAVIYFLFKWLRLGTPSARKPRAADGRDPRGQPHPRDGQVEEMVQDPVCGTWVPIGQAVTLAGKKEILYFCSSECRDKFLAGEEREK